MKCGILRDEQMDVLYGEADAWITRRVQEHQEVCPSCREEMEALRRVRQDLRAWKRPEWRPRVRLPAARPHLFLAAAAVLLLAVGGALGLSGSEFRYENGRFAFRLGRGPSDLDRRLAEQEVRHRQELEALRASLPPAATSDSPAVLQRVEAMIRASEQRQVVTLQANLTALAERAEMQRRYDLARVSAGLSYLDGKTGQHVARTTELMGYMLEAGQKR